MTKEKIIHFGIIGGGLMGREFASAVSRWMHLRNLDFEPRVIAACSNHVESVNWFRENIPGLRQGTTDYRELLSNPQIDAIYCAVPHHLHQQMYVDILQSGKHLLGEKPFGIDQAANAAILQVVKDHPELIVRCSSEFPFYPGAYKIFEWVNEGKFGRIIEAEAGFWHSSDLDPQKPINWKRVNAACGEYGCMGDLGMHVLHLPLRFGWHPKNVRALLSKVVDRRPDGDGSLVICDTWDNAILACEVQNQDHEFPMLFSMKRIAPGHANTWFLRIYGTAWSAEFSTKNPKQLVYLPYQPGGEQSWHHLDIPHKSAYGTITGSIFEFGFSDAIMQMIAAFCDELIHGSTLQQPLYCATPQESGISHEIFTAALASHSSGQTISL